MKKLTLFLLLFASCFTLFAHKGDTLYIKNIYEKTNTFFVEDIERIDFSGLDMNVQTKNRMTNTYSLDDITLMTFYDFSKIIFPPVSSIEGTDIAGLVKIYPNPANDNVNIESLFVIKSIIFYDMSGRVVLRKKDVGNGIVISLTGLKSGLYYVNIDGQVCKLIKN
jgi:hypothetical protein